MIPDWEHNCVCLAAMLKVRHPALFTKLHQILTDHGVHVRLLDDARDIWARDYCPLQVGPGRFVKFRYAPDYLRGQPQLRTGPGIVKSFHDVGHCRRSAIILDGGNIVASQSRAILSDKIFKENPEWNRADLREKLQELLRIDELIVIPKEPFDPIGHADAMVRFIDEGTVLVNDYSTIDPSFGRKLVKVIARHALAIEIIPYFHDPEVTDGIPSAVGCYVNFIRTEQVIVVPTYGNKLDSVALKKVQTVFPGTPVIPLDCASLAREGGVLNCVSASFRLSHKSSSD